ncbi:MAG: DsbA family protein [Serratia sp. (in: enterobacteria)]|uniref:DsbA family protein n=1 Tax=Serratia sp. (in: enterobacteria) TaxID=616 RepID=UPI003F34252F
MMQCDPVTGSCLLPDESSAAQRQPTASSNVIIRYVGDPMCSWCWGISPAVKQLAEFCDLHCLHFAMTMGGLRAGGGDAWNPAFKTFLRQEWSHIQATTGQPFGFSLLEQAQFNYDTEPACRAVVTASQLLAERGWPPSAALAFLAATQYKFYVHGQDPKTEAFYRDICEQVGLPFGEFCQTFNSQHAREAVNQDFAHCRQWGVRAFPTLLLEQHGEISLLATGYVTAETLLNRLNALLPQDAERSTE